MLSRATSLDAIFILRPFRQEHICCHPSQDVRTEFKRLEMLSHQTIMQYGSPAEAADSQQHLVSTFCADALPDPEAGEDSTIESGLDRARLASLQRSTARLISGQAPIPSTKNRPPARPRNTRSIDTVGSLDSNSAGMRTRGIKRSHPEDSSDSTTRRLRNKRSSASLHVQSAS
jgi:hypothetical protein